MLQDRLNKSNQDGAMFSVSMLQLRGGKHRNITRCFKLTLRDCWRKVRDQGVVWINEVVENASENAGKEYYLPHFHRFALQSVLDVLQVLEKHWDGEIGWGGWTAPAPAA